MAGNSIGLDARAAAARANFEAQASTALAVPAAHRRALESSEPGWRRLRRPDVSYCSSLSEPSAQS